jgi:hypothetical protein
MFFAHLRRIPSVALPAGTASKGGMARRDRLLRELPRALEREEARTFAEAKRMEAKGLKEAAERLFEASREAFRARLDIEAARAGKGDLEVALEEGNRLMLRIVNTM